MKRLRILLADDHDLVRHGLSALIKQEPAWKICGVAATGTEALEKALRLRPDIIIADFTLPGIDGLEVTRRVKKKLPDCEVMLFTGSGESDHLIREAFACGAKAFISKTDAGEFLVDAIKSLGEHQPFLTDKSSAVLFARFSPAGKSPDGEPGSGARLSRKEEALLRLLADGHSNASVAKKQSLSVRTVENQRAGLMEKLELSTFADLVRYAVRNGIIEA